MRFGSVYTESFSPQNQSRDSIGERCTTRILNPTMQISRAKVVTVFKSMRFRRLRDKWNRIVLKTLHFWQRFQIDPYWGHKVEAAPPLFNCFKKKKTLLKLGHLFLNGEAVYIKWDVFITINKKGYTLFFIL